MVKECPILMLNSELMVVKFGDIDVQLPSIKRKAKTVKVECKDGRYTVVSDDVKEDIVPVELPIEKTELTEQIDLKVAEETEKETPKKAKKGKKKENVGPVVE